MVLLGSTLIFDKATGIERLLHELGKDLIICINRLCRSI